MARVVRKVYYPRYMYGLEVVKKTEVVQEEVPFPAVYFTLRYRPLVVKTVVDHYLDSPAVRAHDEDFTLRIEFTPYTNTDPIVKLIEEDTLDFVRVLVRQILKRVFESEQVFEYRNLKIRLNMFRLAVSYESTSLFSGRIPILEAEGSLIRA